MAKTIYLCGFMGCGKTTIGVKLSKMMGRSFVDMDDYIEKKHHLTIPEIFAQVGEQTFRQYETEAIQELSHQGNLVVATGGGAMTIERNGTLAKQNGIVLFLDAPFEDCYHRIAGDSNRPNAHSRTKKELLELYQARYPLYQKNSSYTVDASDSPLMIANRILQLYNR